ncbi:ABC transporter permease [Nocardioides sp. Bht2]|uniref:ABC transporter permease n=1 Tax=Nocardioides sp. Bht2 TaxID=3392297 RepID=UPI0039B50CD8
MVKRSLMAVPILLIVSTITFGLVLAIPGDPASRIAGDHATPDRIEAIRAQLGLDQSLMTQYGAWFSDVVRGDLGNSLITQVPVTEMITSRIEITLSLAILALLFGAVIGIPLGVAAARRPGGVVDRALQVVAAIGIAMPTYWLALLALYVLSLKLNWLPIGQYVPIAEDPWGWFQHLLMPAAVLGAALAAELMRQVRSAMIEVAAKPYVTTAWAVGNNRRLVTWKYMAKNAAMPVVTVLGMQFTRVLGGAVVLEEIFSLPGLGSLVVDAVRDQDLPVIQGVVLVSAVIAVLVNLLVDLSYGFLNPKVSKA